MGGGWDLGAGGWLLHGVKTAGLYWLDQGPGWLSGLGELERGIVPPVRSELDSTDCIAFRRRTFANPCPKHMCFCLCVASWVRAHVYSYSRVTHSETALLCLRAACLHSVALDCRDYVLGACFCWGAKHRMEVERVFVEAVMSV